MSWTQLLLAVGLLVLSCGIWNMTQFTSTEEARDAGARDDFGVGLFNTVMRSAGWLGVVRTYGLIIVGLSTCFGAAMFNFI